MEPGPLLFTHNGFTSTPFLLLTLTYFLKLPSIPAVKGGRCPFPCIKLPTPSSSSCTATATSSSASTFYAFTIRSSQTEEPLRRPVAPFRESSRPSPAPPSSPVPPVAPPPPEVATVTMDDKDVITLEFQRQKAKELQDYFKQKKLEEENQGPFFGFLGKNEIANGRWAMFGFAVGMLTEYATGSDFVEQVKILLSNFGIIDLD